MVKRWNFRGLALSVGIILFISSCISTGKIDEQGRYVPIFSCYRFKDKKGHIQPPKLDTSNIYRLRQGFYLGKEVYPFDSYNNEYKDYTSYIKFYGNGRCLRLGRPVKDEQGNDYVLLVDDLDPSKYDGPSREYYFSKDGIRITTEGFYRGDGGGIFIRSNYSISRGGDTLVHMKDKDYEIYVKEILPDSLKRDYEIDW